MIRTDFSRSFLRMGYDVSEVLTFLADVERTLTGEETDPERVVTAQKALDVEFSTKLRGFNDEEVDAEIDRLIEILRHAERRRVARRENSVGSDVDAAALPAAEPTTASSEYADFGTPEAVEQILRSMTQEKEQS
ncbi:DivIVA domain [Mycobacteroides abscessus subsp. abscessus]|nr:DivIVA domain [Mycobacteroides abscessus subsp. abscessus]